MWFDSSMDILECFKNSFPLSFIFILPFLLVISPVNGAQNFPVYRVNQFDLAGNTYGSRSTLVNMEARSVDSGSLTRKCVVAKLSEITITVYRHLAEQNIGALLILLPAQLDNLTTDQHEQFLAIERLMLSEDTLLPVYFAIEDEEISEICSHVRSSANTDETRTATEALLQSISANGFQMNIHTSAAKRMDKHKTINIHGVLEGSGNAERLPTVLIVAHYDALSVAPGLSYGADSNGSGVAALLELMRIFSRLFSASNKPNYSIAFLLSGSGKLNYFGTRRWLEEMRESDKFPYFNEVETVVCLDSVGSQSSKLYVHVSKPPREGSSNSQLLENLETVASELGSSVEMVHKKISLSSSQLAWEHEQFAMHKMAGMTLSALSTHKSSIRTSALDTRASVCAKSVTENTRLIGEAIARYIFKQSGANDTTKQPDLQVQILQGDLAVQHSMVNAWLDLLTSESRAAQLLHQTSPIVGSLEQAFNRHLQSVAKTSYSCDKREPEFILYDSVLDTMHVYSVKPAVFDLILATAIAGYLGVIYLLSMVYPSVATALMNKPKKA